MNILVIALDSLSVDQENLKNDYYVEITAHYEMRRGEHTCVRTRYFSSASVCTQHD